MEKIPGVIIVLLGFYMLFSALWRNKFNFKGLTFKSFARTYAVPMITIVLGVMRLMEKSKY
ncbi:MAG: hypothetical protein ACI8YQ_001638 [Polaribacter sp.]|jgi:hypothetical protein